MNKSIVAARIALGLVFTVFGLDYFLHYLPDPGASPRGGAFLEALFVTGYMFPLIKGLEILCGLLLLAGRLVPLALALLAPIVVNIACYHLILDPGVRSIAVLVSVLHVFLLWSHRASFAPLLGVPAPAPPHLPFGAVPVAAERA
jgi:putative oxidoreductase